MALKPENMPMLTRSVPVVELELNGNELEAILVPWDTATDVADPMPDGTVERYREGFLRTAFDRQLEQLPASVSEVSLIPRHGSTETFGRLRSATVAEKGLHGVVGLLPSRRDDVASMVEGGVDSLSIEFRPLERSTRPASATGGVRWRAHAFLEAVAMTAVPAYVDAKVLAVRDDVTAELARIDKEDTVRRDKMLADLEAEIESLKAGAERWR